jgi:hypothetical protein
MRSGYGVPHHGYATGSFWRVFFTPDKIQADDHDRVSDQIESKRHGVSFSPESVQFEGRDRGFAAAMTVRPFDPK